MLRPLLHKKHLNIDLKKAIFLVKWTENVDK